MSDPDSPLSRGFNILLIIFGCVMLLPGLCAVMTAPIVFAPAHNSFNFGMLALWLLALAVAAIGVALIAWAKRRLER